jgi:hypothetical protein
MVVAKYLTLKLFNALSFLWFTAANIYVFALLFKKHKQVGTNPPDDKIELGYGIGKETFLTPSPWVYSALFLIHISLAGTVAFSQWTDRGDEILVKRLTWRFSTLMLLSTVWTGTWVTQHYAWSLVAAAVVAMIASNIYAIIKREFRLESGFDFKDQLFIHMPFSIFHGWTTFILGVNIFATFAPISARSGVTEAVTAIWILAVLTGLSAGYAFATTEGDISGTAMITFGLFAIFIHQSHAIDHGANPDVANVVRWFAFAFAWISLMTTAKSLWGHNQVYQTSAGVIRLEESDDHV